jgi:hypothetical protein
MDTFKEQVLRIMRDGVQDEICWDSVAGSVSALHDAAIAATEARVRAECEAEIDAEARAWAQFPAGPILKALANKIREGK